MSVVLPELPTDLRIKIQEHYKSNPYSASVTSVSLEEALVIASAVYSFRLARTLEIGFAAAGSSTAVLAAKMHAGLLRRHVAVDPYQRTLSASGGLKVIERLGYSDQLELIEDWSEHYLPKAAEASDLYDLIVVDGGHGMGQAVVDAYYCDRLLPVGGFIAIDDIYLRSTAYSIEFLVNEANYEIVDCRPGWHNPLSLLKRGLRCGYGITRALMSKSVDGLALLRKAKEHPVAGYWSDAVTN
jgi:hypothetical protein